MQLLQDERMFSPLYVEGSLSTYKGENNCD